MMLAELAALNSRPLVFVILNVGAIAGIVKLCDVVKTTGAETTLVLPPFTVNTDKSISFDCLVTVFRRSIVGLIVIELLTS